ncbi:hypothetical protein BDV28DRAFT_145692 [Aspergillus coremiiformis]|uniref:Mid2 domain-containing protein n=1 Tax=Aspergillus coremiiformis TaxID=138285 RepID=A0A5N6ZFB3_9EURO|nr:hypothetical protein BDV28DRAFT_145692 [Aspergillus coremiiformis]
MLKLLFAGTLLSHYYDSATAEPGIFYNPPTGGPIHVYKDNPVYELEQKVQLRWATNLERISLMLWQNDNPNYEWLQTNLSGTTKFDWIVSTQRNLDDGIVFFFQIRDADDLESSNLFASHYFNITKSVRSALTTTTSSTTSSTMSSTAATSTTPVPTLTVALTTSATMSIASPTVFPSPSDEGGISPQATVGISVGVGLGCAFLMILAAVIWFFRRRARQFQADRAQNYVSGSTVVADKQVPLAEFPSHQLNRHELPS